MAFYKTTNTITSVSRCTYLKANCEWKAETDITAFQKKNASFAFLFVKVKLV